MSVPVFYVVPMLLCHADLFASAHSRHASRAAWVGEAASIPDVPHLLTQTPQSYALTGTCPPQQTLPLPEPAGVQSLSADPLV